MIDRIRAYLAKGEYLATKRLVSGLLASEGPSEQDKAEAGILGARAALMLKEPYLAVKFAEKSLAYAQECAAEEAEGRALYMLGTSLLYVGDNAQARVFLRQFIDGLNQQWPGLAGEMGARAFGNLAQVLRNQRLYGDSLQAYLQALTRFQQDSDVRGQIMVHHQMAWVLMLLGEIEEAGEHMEQATAFGEIPPELATYHLDHEALLLLHQGQLTGALEKAQEVLAPDRPHVESWNRAVANYVAGEVCRRVKQYREARTFAYLAREAAIQAGIASILNLVNSLLKILNEVSTGDGA